MSNKNFKNNNRHNYNRHNYNQYANKTETTPSVESEELKDVVEQSEVDEVETVEEEVKEAMVNSEPDIEREPEPHYGVVNCAKLNVRKGPSVNTDALCIIEFGSELGIEQFDTEWLKVVTPECVEGYCMRKFIDVK